jgi:hypothetical protein
MKDPTRPTFGQIWASQLWQVMSATTRGYHRHSLRNTGKGNDRRKDKLEAAERGIPTAFRRYRDRYSTVPAK